MEGQSLNKGPKPTKVRLELTQRHLLTRITVQIETALAYSPGNVYPPPPQTHICLCAMSDLLTALGPH